MYKKHRHTLNYYRYGINKQQSCNNLIDDIQIYFVTLKFGLKMSEFCTDLCAKIFDGLKVPQKNPDGPLHLQLKQYDSIGLKKKVDSFDQLPRMPELTNC